VFTFRHTEEEIEEKIVNFRTTLMEYDEDRVRKHGFKGDEAE
jgi:hypothetical protein